MPMNYKAEKTMKLNLRITLGLKINILVSAMDSGPIKLS